MRAFVCMCIATFVLAVTAAAQVAPTSQPQQDDKIIVGTNLVTVNVIVTDTSGRYVKDLSRDQFTIYDNKVKQEIAYFSAGAASVSIGIVCEIHESAEQIQAVLAAVKHFTSTLESKDDFFSVAFNPHGSVSTDFIPLLKSAVGSPADR